ncbi:hypothetical protein, partial [Nonomuraea sp. NPDC049141]|uniref:hypothetical protein n=1 Tax=Nonomuraea sp. NPDC049141 TaxID=3155500 RepID=UPI0033E55C3C
PRTSASRRPTRTSTERRSKYPGFIQIARTGRGPGHGTPLSRYSSMATAAELLLLVIGATRSLPSSVSIEQALSVSVELIVESIVFLLP